MRILILGIYHDPEPIPKTGELARELKRRGHDVQVVTAFPHYPSGTVYPGYRLRLWMREVRDGVPVLRTYIYPYHGKNAVKRMLNYGSWMVTSLLAAALTPRMDVMYVWHPPPTVGVSAWIIGKLKRIRYVYDVQDLWPQGGVAVGMLKPGLLVNLMMRLADFVYKRAPHLLAVSEEMKASLVSRGVPASKIDVAKHWITEPPPSGGRIADAHLDLGGRFAVIFAGNLGLVQGLDCVLDAAHLLRHDPDIVFVLVGGGLDRQRLEDRARQMGLSNVIFAGPFTAAQMAGVYAQAGALLVQVRGTVGSDVIPTKMLAYLASGRPIICAMRGATARLARDAGAGPIIEPSDPKALADACRALAALSSTEREALGRKGRAHYLEHYDRDKIMDFYEELLTRFAAPAAVRT